MSVFCGNGVQLLILRHRPLIPDTLQCTFQAVWRLAARMERRCLIDRILRPVCWSRLSWYAAVRVATVSLCERSASTTATRSTTRCIILLWWEQFRSGSLVARFFEILRLMKNSLFMKKTFYQKLYSKIKKIFIEKHNKNDKHKNKVILNVLTVYINVN